MTVVIVSYPDAELEIRHAIRTYEHFAREKFEWLFLTESHHLARMAKIVDGRPLFAMGKEIEEAQSGYMRQMCAKMFCTKWTEDPFLVITDDDTEAIAPWSRETFFLEDGRARIFYRPSDDYYWREGQVFIFRCNCPRNFQLRLPFSIRRETLVKLQESRHGLIAFGHWKGTLKYFLSEFALFGEFAWRFDRAHAEFFNSVFAPRNHWSLGSQPSFRDWQGFRPSLRKKIRATNALDFLPGQIEDPKATS